MTPDAEDIVRRARRVIAQSTKYHMPYISVELAKGLLRAVEALEHYAEGGEKYHDPSRARECLASLGVTNVPK